MSIFKDGLIRQGASGSTDSTYFIDQSIRFNATDTSYMTKTISSTGSRTTWTFSTWFKLGTSAISISFSGLFSAVYNSSNYVNIALSNSTYGIDFLLFNGNSTLGRINTDRMIQDPSAWYHLVALVDTTNDVEDERMRLYINGLRETSFYQESYPSKDATPYANLSSSVHRLGSVYNGGTYNNYYYDGYMAETHFLDGYAYGPENFGEFEENGIWIPKAYEGSYGTNGFYIDGRDSSDLGDDESGQSNDYTTSGLAAHDQVLDSPTNNFAVLNPVDTHRRLSNGILRNGNLELRGDVGSNNYRYGRATFGFDVTDSNGWYWETMDVVDGSGIDGVTEIETDLPSSSTLAFTGARGRNAITTHMKLENTTYNSVDLIPTTNAFDIISYCVKNGKVFIAVNGTYVLSGNPATEANPLFSGLTGTFAPFAGLYDSTSYNYKTYWNFGQEGTFGGRKTAGNNKDANGFGNFFYTVPDGAKALCSRSLGA